METYKFNNEEKELARRITNLQGQINRLNVIFEHNRSLNNHIVHALQSGRPEFAIDLWTKHNHGDNHVSVSDAPVVGLSDTTDASK